MAKKKLIIMTQKDLSRYDIIKNLINEKINGTEASKQLNLSVRQIKRLKNKVKIKGIEGIIHGNRGKESNRKISEKKIIEMEKIVRKKYFDFKPTFASEKLSENHQIEIGKETLRQLMIGWKLWKPKSRKKNNEHRNWRPRKEQFGEMQQFDGSYHKWFGDQESCLLLSVDDATGKITHAKFDYNEGVVAVFKFWKEYFNKNGLPLSIYLDKFSTYKVNHKNAVDNKDLITQFQRAMNQSGVNLITAHSPQAKGRVERMNGTLQDRLVKELKLTGITTIEKANEFLKEYIPKFNQKFSVVPEKEGNLHRKLNRIEKKNLEKIFSIQNKRVVNNDFTIRFQGRWFQLEKTQPTLVLRKDKVLIETRIDNSIFISFRDKNLNYKELPKRPEKVKMKIVGLTRKEPSWKPPADHPWRKSFIPNSENQIAGRSACNVVATAGRHQEPALAEKTS